MNTVRRPRRLALAVASLTLALATTGCTYFNPVQTHDFYQTADGGNASLVREGSEAMFAGVRNALLVADGPDSGSFYGSVVNYTAEPIVVDLEGSSEEQVLFSTTVTVPAGGVVEIGPTGDQTVGVNQEFPLGAVVSLSVSADGVTEDVSLPTTGTSLEYLRPDGATPYPSEAPTPEEEHGEDEGGH